MTVPFRVELDESSLCSLGRLQAEGIVRVAEEVKQIPGNAASPAIASFIRLSGLLAAATGVQNAAAFLREITGVSLADVEGAGRLQDGIIAPCTALLKICGDYVRAVDMPDLPV